MAAPCSKVVWRLYPQGHLDEGVEVIKPFLLMYLFLFFNVAQKTLKRPRKQAAKSEFCGLHIFYFI